MKKFYTLVFIGAVLLMSPWCREAMADDASAAPPAPGIPIHFKADGPGFVTLVLEDKDGNRIQNLVFDHPVQTGDNIIYWDGSSLTGLVTAGTYKIRGVFHEGITPRLEYSIYSPGTPPWPTADGTGAWMADHGAPAAALFLPDGSPFPAKDTKPVVLLGADTGEAGNPLMWVDLDGHKLGGTKIAGWNGGIVMARDIGSTPNPAYVAYTLFVGNPSQKPGQSTLGNLHVYGITPTGVQSITKVEGGQQMRDGYRQLDGLAAYNGLLLVSDVAANEIFAIDVRGDAKDPFATFPIDKLGGIAFEPDGSLLVASGGAIMRYDVSNDWSTFNLTGGKVVVAASDLQAPKQIIEQDNEIYVSDWGTSHQVKVFDAKTGKLVRTIGKPGGPQIGDYDEQRMAHPMGMCIDSKGVLWVAENDFLPKRISRWNAKTGAFINAWYGPTQYGGGGYVDPADKSRAYYPSLGNMGGYGLLEFKVDLATGQSKLAAVRYRFPDPLDDILLSSYAYQTKPIFFPTDMIPEGSHGGIAPGQTFYFKGHQYFTDSYNGYWYVQTSKSTLWILENGVCRPIAYCGFVGNAQHRWAMLNDPAILAKIPPGPGDNVFFVWTDRHHDHAFHPEDIQFSQLTTTTGPVGTIFQPDLSILSSVPFQLMPKDVDASGVPDYDLSQIKSLSDTASKGDVALSPDGWLVTGMTGFKDGQQRWTLATRDHKTPPTGPGDLETPDRMLGYPVKSAQGEAGYLVARYSYMGEIYIYSTDGILVATLGADVRNRPVWPYPEAKPGMAITDLSFDSEQFWPFMFGLNDGNVYLSVGKWHASIVRLDGLDKVKRIDLGQIDVTDQMIADAAPARDQKVKDDATRDQISVPTLQAKVDGDLSEWPADGWVPLTPTSSFQVGLSGDKLVVAYRTDQKQLLLNSASEFPYAFAQGGGLDLMLRTTRVKDPNLLAGDIRLFVTMKNLQPLAVLYRQKTADGTGTPQTFASPVGQVTFDDVEDVSKDVEVAQSGTNYEFSIPLSVLGLNNPKGNTFQGDVGMVLSDGAHARARIYWHDKADSMSSDLPSEARLNPGEWGHLKF